MTGMRIIKRRRKSKPDPVDVAGILAELQRELAQIDREIRSLKRKLGYAEDRAGDPTKGSGDSRKNLLSNLE